MTRNVPKPASQEPWLPCCTAAARATPLSTLCKREAERGAAPGQIVRMLRVVVVVVVPMVVIVIVVVIERRRAHRGDGS